MVDLAAPCRDCNKPYSYVCASCTMKAKGNNPVCMHCCPNRERGSGFDCGAG